MTVRINNICITLQNAVTHWLKLYVCMSCEKGVIVNLIFVLEVRNRRRLNQKLMLLRTGQNSFFCNTQLYLLQFWNWFVRFIGISFQFCFWSMLFLTSQNDDLMIMVWSRFHSCKEVRDCFLLVEGALWDIQCTSVAQLKIIHVHLRLCVSSALQHLHLWSEWKWFLIFWSWKKWWTCWFIILKSHKDVIL